MENFPPSSEEFQKFPLLVNQAINMLVTSGWFVDVMISSAFGSYSFFFLFQLVLGLQNELIIML